MKRVILVLLSLAEMIWTGAGPGGPALVRWGNWESGGDPALIVAGGDRVFVFLPSAAGYFLSATIEAGAEVLSLAVSETGLTAGEVFLGLEDRVVVYSVRQGEVIKLSETEPDPGARFVDLVLADLDGDGREEVVAASEGRNVIYIYRLVGDAAAGLSLEPLAIRALPGPAQKLAILKKSSVHSPLIAVAYKNDSSSGIMTLYFTEIGFAEGPALGNLPVPLTSLAAGELRQVPGVELAWGGEDGAVRIVEVGWQLVTALTSGNLGSAVTALAVGRLAGESFETLIAGTPEGFVFGFGAPVERTVPDWTLHTGKPTVYSLALSSEALLGLGATDGSVQVWLLSTAGRTVHNVLPYETLSIIAGLYKTTVEAIVEANRVINPDLLFAGRRLLIP